MNISVYGIFDQNPCRHPNRPCATTTSTHSVSPDSMSPPKLKPVEAPWYVTRMPGGVGGAAP